MKNMENVFTKENTEGFTENELKHLNITFDGIWKFKPEESKTDDAKKNLSDEILSRADRILMMWRN